MKMKKIALALGLSLLCLGMRAQTTLQIQGLPFEKDSPMGILIDSMRHRAAADLAASVAIDGTSGVNSDAKKAAMAASLYRMQQERNYDRLTIYLRRGPQRVTTIDPANMQFLFSPTRSKSDNRTFEFLLPATTPVAKGGELPYREATSFLYEFALTNQKGVSDYDKVISYKFKADEKGISVISKSIDRLPTTSTSTK